MSHKGFEIDSTKHHVCMVAYTHYLTDARVRREAETLAELPSYTVSILTLKSDQRHRTFKIENVEVIELNVRKYQGKNQLRYIISYLMFMLLAFIKCNSFLFSRRTKIYHIHNMPDFLIFSAIIPRLYGRKLILDIHDSMPESYHSKFSGTIANILFYVMCLEEKICCLIANKILCVNHVQKEALLNRGIKAGKIHISMNVPDPKKFPILLNEASSDNMNEFNLVYHGTIAKRLGIDLSIKAVSKLIDKIPHVKFFIFGTGDDITDFLRLTRSLGLSNHVFFSQKLIPIEGLTLKLKDMHLGVISNRKNIATDLMLPVKMLEYIALGIPVLAPELKAIKYYFTADMVSYFKPDDEESLAHGIFDLFNHKDKRKNLAQNARRFLEKYGWEKHKQGLINLYHELCAG